MIHIEAQLKALNQQSFQGFMYEGYIFHIVAINTRIFVRLKCNPSMLLLVITKRMMHLEKMICLQKSMRLNSGQI